MFTKRDFEKQMYLLEKMVETSNDIEIVTKTFESLEDFAKSSGLTKETKELQFLKCKFYYNSYQYTNALQVSSNALELYIEEKDDNKVARIYNILGACYHMLMLFDQALIYYTKAYDIVVEKNIIDKDKIKIEAIFNLILCYRKIYRSDMVLQYINIFKELNGENLYFQDFFHRVALVEANTYRDIKNYKKADELYKSLLQNGVDGIDGNTLFLIYDNYILLYIEQGQLTEALRYIEKAFQLKESVGNDYIPWIFLTKAKCLMALEKYSESLNVLKYGLTLAEGICTNEMIIEFQFALVQGNITVKDYDQALKYLQSVEKFMLDKQIKLRNNDLYSFYAEACCGVGEVTKGIEYISKVRKDYLSIHNLG